MIRTKLKYGIFIGLALTMAISCTISYKFNGASIDYTKTKSFSVTDFTIKSPLVYPPLAIVFNEGLKDLFIRQTRLSQVKQRGDIHLEGEITRYDLTPQAVKENAYASQTRLTIAVKVRFKNKIEPKQNFEQTFSAYRDFSSSLLLNDVQDQLIKEITEELTDQIYNATVANW